MNEKMNEETKEWMNKTNEQIHEWMNEQTNEWMKILFQYPQEKIMQSKLTLQYVMENMDRARA